MFLRGAIAVVTLPMLAACAHGYGSDRAIVDNCRAGGGLTLSACECVRSQMRASMDDYAYDAMVLLANGRDVEAGARLDGLTERDQVAVAGKMMSAYTLCARPDAEGEHDGDSGSASNGAE
ncbi:MAG: hypothetical protein EON93_11885 [Burkholderiales bacterium]|nr:MAG: hypothetical protein EON93_11885 [Burkholderiales bacterium]